MSDKRFRANFDVSIYDSEKEEYISVSERGLGEIAKRMNEQQVTIQSLKEKNEKLRQMIKENVFQRYRDDSLADLEFKAIAYDDIVEVKLSDESEPKVIVYCKQGKKENVMSFCQMFIPFGVYYEIKELEDE